MVALPKCFKYALPMFSSAHRQSVTEVSLCKLFWYCEMSIIILPWYVEENL